MVTLLPLPFLFAMGQIGGAIAWLFLPQYRKLALRNVRIAFSDELSEKQMRRIVRQHFQQLGANLLCSVKFPRMPIEKILERVRRASSAGKGVVEASLPKNGVQRPPSPACWSIKMPIAPPLRSSSIALPKPSLRSKTSRPNRLRASRTCRSMCGLRMRW